MSGRKRRTDQNMVQWVGIYHEVIFEENFIEIITWVGEIIVK